MMKKFCLLLQLFLLFTTTTCFAGHTSRVDYQVVVTQIKQLGDDLISQYDPKNGVATMDGFSKLYFDHYEASGMELSVAAISPTINSKTEAYFTQLIGSANDGVTHKELQTIWTGLKIQLNADVDLLKNNTANHFAEAFFQSFSILLREGFEALLIITALLTFLRRSHHETKSKVVYYGVGMALIASIITAYCFATIFKNLGTHREAMEGIVMLSASAVMFYVSYWLLAKRESMKWQSFIKENVNKALNSSNMMALGLTAFLAVYREGAETILFYQALIIGSKGQTAGIVAGFSAACLALLLIYRVMQTASFKIPYRLFFTVTAIFLYYMSFSFIGSGILELQQAGWIEISPINGFPQIEWLGIFPAKENIGAQLLFLVPTLSILMGWYMRQFFKRAPVSTNR